MSDPVVPQPENEAERAESTGAPAESGETAGVEAPAADVPAADAPVEVPVADPDVAAFEAAERDFPGTFVVPAEDGGAAEVQTDLSPLREQAASGLDPALERTAPRPAEETGAFIATGTEAPIVVEEPVAAEEPVTTALPETAVVAPTVAVEAPAPTAVYAPQPQLPIFVQAPEPPRERSNRGTAAGIGLLAALAFAVLMFAAVLVVDLVQGALALDGLGQASLALAQTWMIWTPTVVFFLAFWLLGVVVNRGRWGLWVNLGLIVGLIAWAGFVLGTLLQAPFWSLTFREGVALSFEAAFSPLGILAFLFARELTIWFGAWVARSGARKNVLNAEAQREYERTLEAGPTLMR